MSRFAIALFTATSLCAIAPVASADSDDDVKLEDVPQAVRDTIKREVKTGEITEIEREEDKGRVYFEVEYKTGAKRFEVHVAEDGKVLLRKPD
jgi:uncharacterized membrane protein YkoI